MVNHNLPGGYEQLTVLPPYGAGVTETRLMHVLVDHSKLKYTETNLSYKTI